MTPITERSWMIVEHLQRGTFFLTWKTDGAARPMRGMCLWNVPTGEIRRGRWRHRQVGFIECGGSGGIRLLRYDSGVTLEVFFGKRGDP